MSATSCIRLATPDDAQSLGEIQAASHLATYRGVMPDSVLARVDGARMAERFYSRLTAAAASAADDGVRSWVLETDDKIVGYATTEPGASRFLPPPEGAGELESLYVHPDALGRGFGRALHQHSIDDLTVRGFSPLVLWAFAANFNARQFYERAGWILDVDSEHWVLDGVSCPIVRYSRTRR
jgi:GNAT superfamily N-acetyltransferase